MDSGSPFKRRRLDVNVGEREDAVTSRTAALEAELRLLRAENARLLQERQQASTSTSALDRLAALRSLAAAPPLPTCTNFSALACAQQRLTASASVGVNGLSRDQLLSLSLGTVGTSTCTSTPGLRSLPGRTSTAGILGQAFQLRLQRVQQHQQQQQKQLPAPSLNEEMQGRLNRLQQLSNLHNTASSTTTTGRTTTSTSASSARPTFHASALPTARNNYNLSNLDSLMQDHLPAPKKKPPKLDLVLAATSAPTITTNTTTTCKEVTDQCQSGRKRKPTLLYMPCDDEDLSQYQTQVRKQIEVFEADSEDTSTSARGRNRPIVPGQVGIRCKHCKVVPPQHRQRAAIYYPSKLDRLYQMSQTIASVHLAEYCQHIPPTVRAELARLREAKSAALGGKKYWSDAGRAMGLCELDKRLFYADSDEAKQAKKLAQSKPPAVPEADSTTTS